MTALMAGEARHDVQRRSPALPHVKSGKLRALAVGGAKRSPLLPEVPTVAESGFDFNTTGWYGMLAPRGTPRPSSTRLQRRHGAGARHAPR